MSATGPDPVERAAQISFLIRDAIRKAFPAPQEQFFTVMVPGKVVNLAEYAKGFDTQGESTTPVLPTDVERAQAILCDDMPVLGPVHKLVPAGSTIGIDISDGSLAKGSPEARHHDAMVWLVTRDPQHEKTRVEIYTEKQAAHTKAVEFKVKAFDDALKRAMTDPLNTSIPLRKAAYEMWVAENAKTYRNRVQAAYMDWVVNGNKEEVEYWFAIVDRQSAMSRIEASKEAMRNAVVQDTDGAAEYNTVKLTPSNWAVIAQNKMKDDQNQTKTVEWYTWELSRLKKMNNLLHALIALYDIRLLFMSNFARKNPQPIRLRRLRRPPAIPTNDSQTMRAFLKARTAYQEAESQDPKPDKDKRKALLNPYNEAKEKLKKENEEGSKDDVNALSHFALEAQSEMHRKIAAGSGMAQKWIKTNEETIENYRKEITRLLQDQESPDNAFIQSLAKDAEIPAPMKEPQADTSAKPAKTDFFTAISLDISSSSSEENSSSHATKASFGASSSWGFFGFGFGSASVNAEHSEAASAATKAMNSSSCKISFECMRVDIFRSWLRPELFFDADLTTGPEQVRFQYLLSQTNRLSSLGASAHYGAHSRETPDYGGYGPHIASQEHDIDVLRHVLDVLPPNRHVKISQASGFDTHLLTPHLHRCAALDYDGDFPSYDELWKFAPRDAFVNLHSVKFQLIGGNWKQKRPNSDELWARSKSFFSVARNLNVVILHGDHNWSSTLLSIWLPWQRLTILHHVNLSSSLQAQALPTFLQHCSSLTVLKIYAWERDQVISSLDNGKVSFHFPHLQTFVVVGYNISQLFSMIHDWGRLAFVILLDDINCNYSKCNLEGCNVFASLEPVVKALPPHITISSKSGSSSSTISTSSNSVHDLQIAAFSMTEVELSDFALDPRASV
ncbi:hypothetical protein H0H92_005066 [Tricholoma furcatifolium]|nr:hypothetical protein H0H92_005066 [Tricholoma furcatifolium]